MSGELRIHPLPQPTLIQDRSEGCFSGALTSVINTIKTIWNGIVGLLQTLYTMLTCSSSRSASTSPSIVPSVLTPFQIQALENAPLIEGYRNWLNYARPLVPTLEPTFANRLNHSLTHAQSIVRNFAQFTQNISAYANSTLFDYIQMTPAQKSDSFFDNYYAPYQYLQDGASQELSAQLTDEYSRGGTLLGDHLRAEFARKKGLIETALPAAYYTGNLAPLLECLDPQDRRQEQITPSFYPPLVFPRVPTVATSILLVNNFMRVAQGARENRADCHDYLERVLQGSDPMSGANVSVVRDLISGGHFEVFMETLNSSPSLIAAIPDALCTRNVNLLIDQLPSA